MYFFPTQNSSLGDFVTESLSQPLSILEQPNIWPAIGWNKTFETILTVDFFLQFLYFLTTLKKTNKFFKTFENFVAENFELLLIFLKNFDIFWQICQFLTIFFAILTFFVIFGRSNKACKCQRSAGTWTSIKMDTYWLPQSSYTWIFATISESLGFALLKGQDLVGLTGPGRLHLRFLPHFFPPLLHQARPLTSETSTNPSTTAIASDTLPAPQHCVSLALARPLLIQAGPSTTAGTKV